MGACMLAQNPNLEPTGILPTHIQVGTFVLDADDQIIMRDSLLIREVRKAGKVIDRMAALSDETDPGDDQEPRSSASSF